MLSDNFLTKNLNAATDQDSVAKDVDAPVSNVGSVARTAAKKVDITQVLNFLDGKHCLTGVKYDVTNWPVVYVKKTIVIVVASNPLHLFRLNLLPFSLTFVVAQGGGWWKYEFCYGRYVRQFHIDKNGETSLLLGSFDEQAHKDWLKENPQKRPHKGSRFVSHLYQGGSKCDESGELRQTEVQLRCLENSTSKSKVSLFLMEPKTCHYILGVESQFLCDIVEAADEDGLIRLDTFKEMHDEEIITVETVKENEDL